MTTKDTKKLRLDNLLALSRPIYINRKQFCCKDLTDNDFNKLLLLTFFVVYSHQIFMHEREQVFSYSVKCTVMEIAQIVRISSR